MPSIKTQDLYRVVITEAAGIAASGDVDFTVSVAPTRTNGFLVLSPENATSREVVYFHNVIGNRIYVRGVNRRNPKLHPANDSVQMNDVEDIFNYYSDMVSPLFYMEKTGALNVRIWGGTVLVNRTQVTVADTNLTLTDNDTNYIVYDYLTNVVSVNTTGVGLVKVTVAVTSGVIGTPTYNVIKESYADPFVPDVSLVAPVIQNNQFAYATSTGSANAYAVTYTPAPKAYVAGQKFFFKANFQNTGAATINVNGLGAKSIKKLDGATDLASTDISSGAMVEIMYDGTNFQLTSIPQTIKNNDVTQLTSVNNLTSKTVPVGTDLLLIGDSATSFANKQIKIGALISIFGDGSDGAVTISVNTTLTRDMYYTNLTINNGVTLDPAGYKIYCTGTLTNNGTISRPGNVGGTGQLNNTGTPNTGGAALNQGTIGAELGGANSATNGTSANPCYSNVNAANGGRSAQSASVSTGGVSTRGSDYNVVTSPYRIALALAHYASSRQISTQYKGGSSAAGGTNDSNTGNGNTAYGGGGGGNGGTIFISAYAIVNNGTISSIGGAGGAGVSAYGTAFAGGGGGGSGGTVVLIYVTITLGTVTTTGGVGGAASGGASTAGATGATGPVIQIPVTL